MNYKFKSFKYIYLITGVIFYFLVSSCKKFVEIEPAPNLIQTQKVFENDNTATSAAIQIYVLMRVSPQRFTEAGMSIVGGLSADEIYNTTSNSTWDPFFTNSIPSTNTSIKTNLWNAAYQNIYQINAVIEGLTNSNKLSGGLKNQLMGEMKTVRAWYYFYLVNLFGDVPLITGTDYRINAVMPRTSVTQVYNQIINDLTDAQSLLLTSYPSAGKARPNKWVATALLARVYLYQKDWTRAETQASAVINSNAYSLATDLNAVFLTNSTETLWETAALNGVDNTGIGTSYVASSSTVIPGFSLTANLVNAFEAGDLRKVNWLKTNTVGSQTYYYPYKYKERAATTPVKEYNTVLRLDEQYLIRAEARAQLNNIAGAQSDLNIIRTRAGLTGASANTLTTILSAIENERRVELFTEWGHRWFDLKRYGRADLILSVTKGSNWQSTDVLYPIPYDELQYNPSLIQNPGY